MEPTKKDKKCSVFCGGIADEKIKPLSHMAILTFVDRHNCVLHIDKLKQVIKGFTVSMKATLLNALIADSLFMQLHTLVTSPVFFEPLFSTEWHKMVQLHAMNAELEERGRGSIFHSLNQLCHAELENRRENLPQFLSYVPISLNYSLYLIEGGYYFKALKVVNQLKEITGKFLSGKCEDNVRAVLINIYIMALTAKFNCHNTLFELKEGRELYDSNLVIVTQACSEEIPNIKVNAAAFFTQCSRYCHLVSDVHASHKYAMQALELIESKVHARPHPRVVINALRQATLTFLQLGLPNSAKITIETALSLCQNVVNESAIKKCPKCHDLSDSLLFLDCMADYAYFLRWTDETLKSKLVLGEVVKVSGVKLTTLSLSVLS